MLRIIIILLFAQCFTLASAQSDTLRFGQPGEDNDSTEYELIVFDPGYDLFLETQPPMEYYSQEYYEAKNQRYVVEWNMRHQQPLVYGNMYETYIDYRPNIDYGLELNYQLYYYFRFFEKENGVTLIPGNKN